MSLLLGCMGVVVCTPQVWGQLPALGAPPNPKVPLRLDQYYTSAQLNELLAQLAQAHPRYCQLDTVGQSPGGNWLVAATITDFGHGSAVHKPALYLDGNIHSNEVQAAEVVLYTAWYLCEQAERVDHLAQLLRTTTFYLLPCTNPDGRDHFLQQANTPHSPRSNLYPVDDDRDGLVNEDGYDDLNGDGHITLMRVKAAWGKLLPAREDPRRLKTKLRAQDTLGGYLVLGYEGLDNDHDGKINEDGPGYVDPNRDWPWSWQPSYIQRGAGPYPLAQQENRLLADYLRQRRNIAAAITYHNTGGMMLHGPSNELDAAAYPLQDKRVYRSFEQALSDRLPGYRLLETGLDLYKLYGGQADWLYGALGVWAFTGELWTPHYYRHQDVGERFMATSEEQYRFDNDLLFQEAFVPWTPYNHPHYGPIEIGGFKKQFLRANPGFALRYDAHRNLAFALFLAEQLPRPRVDSVWLSREGRDLWGVHVVLSNPSMLPTHSMHNLAHQLAPPLRVTLLGPDEDAPGLLRREPLQGPWLATHDPREPEVVLAPRIPSQGAVQLKWIVKDEPQNARLLVEGAYIGRQEFPLMEWLD